MELLTWPVRLDELPENLGSFFGVFFWGSVQEHTRAALEAAWQEDLKTSKERWHWGGATLDKVLCVFLLMAENLDLYPEDLREVVKVFEVAEGERLVSKICEYRVLVYQHMRGAEVRLLMSQEQEGQWLALAQRLIRPEALFQARMIFAEASLARSNRHDSREESMANAGLQLLLLPGEEEQKRGRRIIVDLYWSLSLGQRRRLKKILKIWENCLPSSSGGNPIAKARRQIRWYWW